MEKAVFCAGGNKLSALMKEFMPTLSYPQIYKIIRNRDVIVDGTRVKQDVFVEQSCEIAFYYSSLNLKCDFEVVFEDDNILIVNKHAGIETCDGEYNVESELCKNQWVRAVHRLDRNTEGLVIFAKTQEVEAILIDAFKQRGIIKKTYSAEVVRTTKAKQENFIASAYLLKHKSQNYVEISSTPKPGYVPIQTEVKLVEKFDDSSIVQVILHTGRTHQIRAHLAFLGMPVVGDGKYGDYEANRRHKAKIQHLCAVSLQFNFPSGPLEYLNDKQFCVSPSWRK